MEHTSLELSKRLHEKGFKLKGNTHPTRYIIMDDGGENPNIPVRYFESLKYSHCEYIPAYTFTELWGALDGKQRKELLIHMLDNVGHLDLNDPAEVAGEWLIDNDHIQCKETP